MITITVIIPTYRRPKDLVRCLEALGQQTRPPNEVLVIVRDNDAETLTLLNKSCLESLLSLRLVEVKVPGQIAALNAGLNEAKCEIVSITDDDAVPSSKWLARIEEHFLSDKNIGGVGGRDWMYIDNQLIDGEREIVGKVQWFGRTIGEHHRGIGESREVEILKGANMSYRKTAIGNLRFDERLLGSGAEVHNDLAFSLSIKKAGWKLIYDPLVEIDHYHGKRFGEDQRGQFNEIAWFNEVHNGTLALMEYLPFVRRIVFTIWSVFVGTRKSFGLLQWLRFFPKEGELASKKWIVSMQGFWKGWQTWRQSNN
jgi:cellulose synthase/poly-beta-1,6-N-acetylglucosamine synthase-like glycosyltransferase